MAIEITIPKMGMTMKDGKLVSWKCQEGDWIEAGQEIYVMETAKVTYDIEALDSGFIHIVGQPGDVLEVGEVAGLLAADEAELSALQSGDGAAVPASSAAPAAAGNEAVEAPASSGAIERPKKVRITPKARRLADQNGFDYSQVQGSGLDGRIKHQDIVAALDAPAAAPATVSAPADDTGDMINGIRVKASIPLEGMRQAIADHMIHSLQSSAQLTAMSEANMTEVIRYREKLLTQSEASGVRATYTDILVYVLARVLKKVPIVNSSLIDGQIRVWEDINIGVATAFDRGEFDSGLLVPVIKHADRKSISEISKEIKELGEKVKTGTITPDEMSGGTFTLSNTGMFGPMWAVSTPIINQPESAIIQTGAIIKRVEEIDGEFQSVPIMPFSITFDHRVLDGVPIGKFTRFFIDMLKDMEMLMF